MNKIRYFIFAILLSVFLIPNVFAKGIVEIKSIELDSVSDNTVINSEPTFDGLQMNFDVSFKEKDDFVKYKVTVQNDTDIDYKISDETSFNKSEYITYIYDVKSELKAGSQTIVYVTITYTKEVDESLLVDNKYTETNRAVVQLNNEVDNPNTGEKNIIVIIVAVMLLAITTLIVINKKNFRYTGFVILIGICLIPVITYAIESIKLTMNVKVQIQKGYEVGYYIESPVLIRDDELDSYTTIDKTKCIVVYAGQTKYNLCEYIIRKDDKMYLEGGTVNLKEISVRNSSNIMTYGPTIQMDEGFCTLRDDGSYVCPEDSVYEAKITRWEYNTGFLVDGYTYLDTDKDVMNFENILWDDWEDNRHLEMQAPQTFKMPAHNVLFEEYIVRLY